MGIGGLERAGGRGKSVERNIGAGRRWNKEGRNGGGVSRSIRRSRVAVRIRGSVGRNEEAQRKIDGKRELKVSVVHIFYYHSVLFMATQWVKEDDDALLLCGREEGRRTVKERGRQRGDKRRRKKERKKDRKSKCV